MLFPSWYAWRKARERGSGDVRNDEAPSEFRAQGLLGQEADALFG